MSLFHRQKLIKVQIFNDADIPQGDNMLLTECEADELNQCLPIGWYLSKV